MGYLLTLLSVFVLFVSGCTTIISDQSLKLVNCDEPFKSIKAAPENYIGKTVLLGGRIASIRNSADGAQLEIVQLELTSQNYPENSFISYGRLIATNSSYMDPLIFKNGMLITLVGELKGKKTLRLDDMDYTYPLISMREWYLWPGSEPDRGCSTYPVPLTEYNPYNFGYGYEPFLPRPYSPFNKPH